MDLCHPAYPVASSLVPISYSRSDNENMRRKELRIHCRDDYFPNKGLIVFVDRGLAFSEQGFSWLSYGESAPLSNTPLSWVTHNQYYLLLVLFLISNFSLLVKEICTLLANSTPATENKCSIFRRTRNFLQSFILTRIIWHDSHKVL